MPSRPASDPAESMTRLLQAWQAGDKVAENRLYSLLYDELRRIAHRQLERMPGRNDTLNTTALVHELYQKLDHSQVLAQDCSHFLCIATRAMRQILIDYSRSRRRGKRGAGAFHVPLGPLADRERKLDEQAALFIDIDRAMQRLKTHQPRLEQIAELHFFGGLTYEEIAGVLGIGTATVTRDWRAAREWLQRELASNPE